MNQYESGVPTEAYVAAQLRRDVEARDNPQPWHGPDRDRDSWEPRVWEIRPPAPEVRSFTREIREQLHAVETKMRIAIRITEEGEEE